MANALSLTGNRYDYSEKRCYKKQNKQKTNQDHYYFTTTNAI